MMRQRIKTKRTSYTLAFCALCLVALSFLYAPSCHAEGKSDRFTKKMPDVPYFNEEAFKEKTKVYKKRPYGDDSLAYKINIPDDWEQGAEKGTSNAQISDKLFLDLNIYYGPPRMGGRSRVEIQAVNMDYDFTAEQWYLKYILESGYTLEGFVVDNDRKIESLMVIMEDDISYYVRTVAQINGKKMILARYLLPVPYWQEEAPMQASVMRSFTLINDIHEQIGKYKKFQFLDVAELQYPETWDVVAGKMASVERMNAKFVNISKTGDDVSGHAPSKNDAISSLAEGHVDVNLIMAASASSLIREIQNYKKKLESTGILVGKKLDIEPDFHYHKNVSFFISEVYEGTDSSRDYTSYELWFTVMVAGNYFYFMTLLTPSETENFVAWAKNVRGYRKIVESLLPTTGAYLERQ